MTDREWMEQALALGALGEAATAPNPRVGCLLVREERIVGRGFHRAPGLPHAEALALADAGRRAHGATLYVNLEPCAHEGRTSPCADAIVKSGISRVVASIRDPNPLVDGRGLERLRAAGVVVETGLLADEAERLNESFLHFHRHGRPIVTLKAASSLDGMLSAASGSSRWISGEPSRRFAHRLRMRHGAVLVGAGTARRDDPRLTVRLPRVTAPRVRAVLAPRLDLDPRARLFERTDRQPLPTIYTVRGLPKALVAGFDGLAEVVAVRDRAGELSLEDVLADLSRREVQSVLVEGGAKTHAGFLDAGLADRMALFLSRKLLGSRGGTPLLDREVVERPALGWRLRDVRQLALGDDLALLGKLEAPAEARA